MLTRSAAAEVEVIYPAILLPAARPCLCVWAGRMRGEQHGTGVPGICYQNTAGLLSERFLFPTAGHAYAFVGYTDYRLTNWEFGYGQRYYIVWRGETRTGQVRPSGRESVPGRD